MKLASTLFTSALAFVVSAVALAGCNSQSSGSTGTNNEPQALTGKDLAGHWVSKGCEAYPDGKGGNNYLTRDFTLTESDWDLTFTVFGDKDCKTALFSSKIHGPYTLGALSAKVEGATEGQFAFKTNDWTAHVQAMADTFTMSGCGATPWQVEKAEDVTATGCIGVAHKLSDCPQEYDVVSVEGDELYFGQRITDMCKADGRPTALNTYAVYKQ